MAGRPAGGDSEGVMSDHNHEGNCWDEPYSCQDCGPGNMCDVCHDHHEPRGECDECPACPACTDAELEDIDQRALGAMTRGVS